MITDRNKLNFVTIQWLWFLCLLILACSCSSISMHNVEATQQQQLQQTQQQQQQHHQQQKLQQLQLKSTLQLQQEVESNVPLQKQHQQQHQQQQDVTVRNFSPRMDYNNNEWRPVGRGDPLKNDPTFDYSPPTLDRVRYWADPDKEKEKMEEVTAALVEAKLKKANPGKNEILLLGVTGDRIRGGAPVHSHSVSTLKNAKGEVPLLQPKYTSIRRSYYAHQIPTHLMPPPMQPMQPAAQQQQLQQSAAAASQHMVKPVHTEYRHNMPGHSYMMTSSPISAMNMHSKPYYMSTSSQPWIHTSSSPSMSSSAPLHSGMMMSGNSQRYGQSHPQHDTHHQESVNYFSYQSRPSMTSTPSIMMSATGGGGGGHHEMYSPNSIRGSSGLHKSGTSSRKPWIHDLLQKEFVKPIKPTMGTITYHSESMRQPLPLPHMESHFEPMLMGPKGISSTYSPVRFVTPTMPTSTTQAQVYITSSTYQTTPPTTSTTTTAPFSYPSYTTHAPRTSTTSTTTTTLSPTRLLIPNTSNLAYRPTVAPMKLTTDSLFSHYNQPDMPLRGPMYLIIEGHSKVKTYGKDELDPHKPKIVPIIPKREPVVRIGDHNEKRGTPETFQVKHLHTKTTPMMEATTSAAIMKTSTTTTTTTTTTKKPEVKTTIKSTTTVKPNTVKTTQKQKVSTTTTAPKPATTKMMPKLSVTTTSTSPIKPKIEQNNKDVKTKPSKADDKSLVDMKMSSKLNTNNPNALDIPQKPSQTIINEPPTGMQGLLSFLDSSLDSIFKEDPLAPPPPPSPGFETKKDEGTTTTKLKPIQMNAISQPGDAVQIESRVSTKLQAIKAEDYDDDADSYLKVTTEYLPRETRQIFDYDQLPESRISDKDPGTNYEDLLEQFNDEDDLSVFNLDDEYEEDEEQQGIVSDQEHNLIKRIDSLVSSTEDDEDFSDISSLDDLTDIDEEEDLEALAESRKQQHHQLHHPQSVKKA